MADDLIDRLRASTRTVAHKGAAKTGRNGVWRIWSEPDTLAHQAADRIEALEQAGKHLAVKLAETYRAAGVNPGECQAIRDFFVALDGTEK